MSWSCDLKGFGNFLQEWAHNPPKRILPDIRLSECPIVTQTTGEIAAMYPIDETGFDIRTPKSGNGTR